MTTYVIRRIDNEDSDSPGTAMYWHQPDNISRAGYWVHWMSEATVYDDLAEAEERVSERRATRDYYRLPYSLGLEPLRID